MEDNDYDTYFLQHELLPIVAFVVIIILVGGIANSVVIAICRKHFPRMLPWAFIYALAIVDLLTCFIVLPADLVTLLMLTQYPSDVLCKLKHYLGHSLHLSSCCILTVIALNRYEKFCQPKHRITFMKRAHKIILSFFILVAITSTPCLIIYGKSDVGLEELPYGEVKIIRLYNQSGTDFKRRSYSNSVGQFCILLSTDYTFNMVQIHFVFATFVNLLLVILTTFFYFKIVATIIIFRRHRSRMKTVEPEKIVNIMPDFTHWTKEDRNRLDDGRLQGSRLSQKSAIVVDAATKSQSNVKNENINQSAVGRRMAANNFHRNRTDDALVRIIRRPRILKTTFLYKKNTMRQICPLTLHRKSKRNFTSSGNVSRYVIIEEDMSFHSLGKQRGGAISVPLSIDLQTLANKSCNNTASKEEEKTPSHDKNAEHTDSQIGDEEVTSIRKSSSHVDAQPDAQPDASQQQQQLEIIVTDAGPDYTMLHALRTCVVVMTVSLLFALTQLPYWIIMFFRLIHGYELDFGMSPHDMRGLGILYYVPFTTCVLNPLVYAFMNSKFRRACKESCPNLKKKWRKRALSRKNEKKKMDRKRALKRKSQLANK